MAESSTSEKSINQGSDQVPGRFCEPCQDISGEIKSVAGYCLNCDESLCQECYDFHLRRKLFRNHQLVDKSKRPIPNKHPKQSHQDLAEKCPKHHGETLQLFCKSHSKLCCKVCITIKHKTCDTEEISKMARNIKTSGQLEDLSKKLSVLKTGFDENLSKIETNKEIIQKNYSQAMDEMKRLRDEFDRLMTKTENQAQIVKEEDLKQSQSVSEASSLIIGQINKITANIDKMKDKSGNENIFIAMKRAENELQAFEESLIQLNSENSVRNYKFEPNMKLQDLINQLDVLGCLSFLSASHTSTTSQAVSLSQQMAKKPTHMKDLNVSKTNLQFHGSVTLPNKNLLITDHENSIVKLIENSNGTIVSEIQLTGVPVNITKVKTDEFAVVMLTPNKIQYLNLSQDKLSLGREISINGRCYGIAFNDKDQTFVMTFRDEKKVQIINMAGTVVRTIKTDSKGSKLFSLPYEVALSPDMSGMYVTDHTNKTVTWLSLNGDVKAVYKDNGLQSPVGLCVYKSGVVYVVGHNSHTVYQLDPNSGEFKLLLGQKEGLSSPYSISYCDVEDKMYVGMFYSTVLKVFEMK